MTPLGIFVLIFAAFGLSFVIGYSKLTLAIREWLATPVKLKQLEVVEKIPIGENSANVIGHPVRPPLAVAQWTLALMECPACLGWHVGFWMSIVVSVQAQAHWTQAIADAIMFGFLITGTNYFLGRVTKLIRDDE